MFYAPVLFISVISTLLSLFSFFMISHLSQLYIFFFSGAVNFVHGKILLQYSVALSKYIYISAVRLQISQSVEGG